MKENMPLAGLRVVELATVVAAPTAGRIMADFGAEVIKIEQPGRGDLLRMTGDAHMLPTTEDNNPLFDMFNSGKKLIAVNLKTEDGKALLFRLLENADIFLTNTRLASLTKLGLDYEQLQTRFPRLIYAHFSGFGPQGPDRERPGFDTTAFWLRSGAALDWAAPGGFPVRATFGFGDIATAGYFLDGILMALLARGKTGKGTLIESSLFAAGLWHNAPYILNCQPPYGRRYPVDRWDPWDPFSDYYQCSDGEWIAPVKKDYSKDRWVFAEIFNMPELISDPDYESLSAMRKAGKIQTCTKTIARVMARKPAAEWEKIFTERDIPYERARHFLDACDDRQAWENEYLEKVPYPGSEGVALPVPPLAFSAYERASFRRQGRIGSDTDEVLTGVGYEADQIAELRKKGVVA